MLDYGSEPERCAQCHFDGSAYTDLDVDGTLRAISPWWHLMVDHIDDAVLQRRPGPGVWSAVEYAEHSIEITRIIATGLAALLEQDGIDFGTAPAERAVIDTPSTTPMK